MKWRVILETDPETGDGRFGVRNYAIACQVSGVNQPITCGGQCRTLP